MLNPPLKKNEYEIFLHKNVHDYLERLKKKDKGFYLEIYNKFDKIQENPFKGKLLSKKYKNHFRERVRNFRIIYTIVDLEIRVLAIGNRDDIYKTRMF